MNYIVLDLEWNQPVSFEAESYRRYGDRLLFEIIQIGAVKLGENLEILGEKSIIIRPVVYKKLHSMVKRMTHITPDMLDKADIFPFEIGKFLSWCGEDCCFVTWGDDDRSVMEQNMKFHNLTSPLPPFYDLQRLYCSSMHIRGARGLKTALDEMGIMADDEHKFHNAYGDAYYTALIFQRLTDWEKITQFPEGLRELRHMTPEEKMAKRAKQKKPSQSLRRIKPIDPSEGTSYSVFPKSFGTVEDVMSDKDFQHLPCPVCRKRMKPDYAANAGLGNGNYASILKCPVHGHYMVRYCAEKAQDGTITVLYGVTRAADRDVSAVHQIKYEERSKKETK